MRYEKWNGLDIPKIGYGTYRIGGNSTPDPSKDESSLKALHTAIELGYTHFDTAESYAGGRSEILTGQAVRESGIPRERFMVATKISPEHLNYRDALNSCEGSLRRMKLDYIDLYLIHWPREGMDLADAFRGFNQLIREGKVRHMGVSNFSVEQLEEALRHSETPLLTNQVPFSVNHQGYVRNGVLAYCQANNILLTAYSPVKTPNIDQNETLRNVAVKYGITPHQLAIAWTTSQSKVITIPMSMNPQHQADNMAAGDIILEEEDLRRLAFDS